MIKKVLFTITLLCLISCEKEECPAGSIEVTSAFGDFTDCIDVNFKNLDLNKDTDVFI